MAPSPKPSGAASARVAANLRHLRNEQGLSYAELARRLDGIGHPVGKSALLKTETGTRRVDADDLTALAAVLGVSPARLLLPAPGDQDSAAVLIGGITAQPRQMWAWSAGEIPLGAAPAAAASGQEARDAEYAFAHRNRLHRWRTSPQVPAVPAPGDRDRALALAALAASALEAFRAGATTADIRDAAEAAVVAALAIRDPEQIRVRVEADERGIWILTSPDEASGSAEATA